MHTHMRAYECKKSVSVCYADDSPCACMHSMQEAMSSGAVVDGVVSGSEFQSAAIWRLREGLSEAMKHRGKVHEGA